MSGVYLLVTVLIAQFLFWHRFRSRTTPTPTVQDVREEMHARAREAVETAKSELGVTLDFTPESVQQVESILATIHDRHQQATLADDQLVKEALKWGAYVGEVIKTQKQSHWAIDSTAGGPGSFPIVYKDEGESFPVRWCYKRIINGTEENVWHKFSMLVLERDDQEISETTPDKPGQSSPADAN